MICTFFPINIFQYLPIHHVPRPWALGVSTETGCPGSAGSSFRSRLSTGSASHGGPPEELGCQATSLPVAAWTAGPLGKSWEDVVFFFRISGGKRIRIMGIVIEFGGVRVESCNEHVYKFWQS